MTKTPSFNMHIFKNSYIIGIQFVILSILLVGFINYSSIISYLYALIITVLLYVIIFKEYNSEVILLFGLYSLITIAIFLVQLISLPDYFGFSGGLGIGTDDSYFYSQITSDLPHGFPLREGYDLYINKYSKMLIYITPFKITHPFDVLFINSIPITLLPLFTRGTALLYFKDKEIAWYAFVFMAICPYTLSNSLILIRDGWIATLMIGSIYFLHRKQYLLLIISVFLLFYLRIASGALGLFLLVIFMLTIQNELSKNIINKIIRISFIAIIIISIIIFLSPIIIDYMKSKNIYGTIFRESIANRFFIENDSNSFYASILSQPAYIRIPLVSVFYVISPLFSPDSLVRNGVFIPRALLTSIIYPFLAIFYLKYFIQAIIYMFKNPIFKQRLLLLLYIFSIIIISQLSLQPRHKTMIMPLFYLLVSSGLVYKENIGKKFSNIIIIFLIFFQLLLFGLQNLKHL
ncbi:MAG: hypothetical protein ACOCP8_06555 [archaeon]